MSFAHLSCREIADFLMAYLDNDLEPERRSEFERHLGACPPCINYLKTYQRAVELARSAHQCDSMRPPPVPEQLVRAILAARKVPGAGGEGAGGGDASSAGGGSGSCGG